MTPRTTGTAAVLWRTVAVVTVALAAAACSQSSSSPPPTSPAADTTTTTVAPSTSTSTTSTTAAPTTSTVAPATVPPTSAPETTVTEPPSTTESPVTRELVLREDGLGSATFGADPEGVIEYVTSFLGSPTSDTEWTESDEFAICPGTEVRRVEWGVLRLGFGDVSREITGRRHFYSWHYGLVAEIGGEPQGLRTEEGLTLGSRVVDLRAAHPDVRFYEGDEELFPPAFELSLEFYGSLTGLDDDDVVTEMFSGYVCGE